MKTSTINHFIAVAEGFLFLAMQGSWFLLKCLAHGNSALSAAAFHGPQGSHPGAVPPVPGGPQDTSIHFTLVHRTTLSH